MYLSFQLSDSSAVNVISCESESGSAVGDGLTSVIKILDVRYEVKGQDSGSVRLVGKMFPLGSKMSDTWEKSHLFERETQFYGSIKDKILDIMKGMIF